MPIRTFHQAPAWGDLIAHILPAPLRVPVVPKPRFRWSTARRQWMRDSGMPGPRRYTWGTTIRDAEDAAKWAPGTISYNPGDPQRPFG